MVDQTRSRLSHQDLWQRWKEDEDPDARKRLIEHLFAARGLRVQPNGGWLTEERNEGRLGKQRSDGFNRRHREIRLPPRACNSRLMRSWRIRGAIIDGLRQGDWVPRSVRDKAKKMEDAYAVLEQKHLRSATDDEICAYLNISDKEFQQMLQEVAVAAVFSLEDPIREEESETRLRFSSTTKPLTPNRRFMKRILKDSSSSE